MGRKQWLLLSTLLLGVATHVEAQTIIGATRRIDWTQAGIPGGIPNRTTICATLRSAYKPAIVTTECCSLGSAYCATQRATFLFA